MAMTVMATSTPGPGSFIDVPSRDAARNGASHDEPPAADNLLDEERDQTSHHPGDATPSAAPERDQHGGKKDRHHEIDTERARIGHKRTQPIAGADRGSPHPK